jgi:hypothetical protein
MQLALQTVHAAVPFQSVKLLTATVLALLQVVAYEDKRSAQAEALYERSQEQSAVGGEGDKSAVHSLTSALTITPQDIKLLVARAACYRCVRVGLFSSGVIQTGCL